MEGNKTMRINWRRKLWLAAATCFLSAAHFAAADEPVSARVGDDLAAVEVSDVHIADVAEVFDTSADVVSEAYDAMAGGNDGSDAKDFCSCEKMTALNKAAAGAYKTLFYDNNFDYLCDPCYDGWHLGENLKRLNAGHGIVVDVGGQYRMRFHNEVGIRNTAAVPNFLGLTGADDNFTLHRTRVYANAQIGSRLRFYGEMLDAYSKDENLVPRAIEENRSDVQNLFIDAKIFDDCCRSATARVGRQELAYGSQRLVSVLDWANTRRTFDGAKLMWRGPNWDIDGFWTRPLQRNAAHRTTLDEPWNNRDFYGLYNTYKGLCQDNLDLYWLALDNHDAGFLYDTLGLRYNGSRNAWMFEVEADYQFGRNTNGSDHSAGAFTVGLGRKFDCVCWKPQVWAFYDWASGDDTVGNGFHHMFPLAHKYLGFMDLYGRRNIQSANVQVTAQPHERVKLMAWYYNFQLQNINDVPYNVDMTAFNGMTAGSAGSRDLGNEIDLTATITLTPRSDLLFGYSHFYAGNFYDTSPVPFSGDADFFYTQFHVNF